MLVNCSLGLSIALSSFWEKGNVMARGNHQSKTTFMQKIQQAGAWLGSVNENLNHDFCPWANPFVYWLKNSTMANVGHDMYIFYVRVLCQLSCLRDYWADYCGTRIWDVVALYRYAWN